ncbi:MAG: metallophosphoesterase, partial [Candidatus Atribacteria bacterium]|nr:metallophosphoesterase [Candidatus Atribacteria bacterium]
FSDPDTQITILYFSDIHWMAKACAEKEVRRTIDRILTDPNCFWIGGGDYSECIGHQDSKRFHPDAVAEWVKLSDLGCLGEKAFKHVGNLFKPIIHKCLGLILGNHEAAHMKYTTQAGLFDGMCRRLSGERDADDGGPPHSRLDLSYSALMDLYLVPRGKGAPALSWESPKNIRGVPVKKRIFCHHGAGYAMTKGGKINRLIRFMDYFDADIYMLGHVHDDLGVRITPLCANEDCTHITNRTKLGVISGSYLKTYAQDVTTYGEQRGYEPVSLGAAWVRIDARTGEMEGRI